MRVAQKVLQPFLYFIQNQQEMSAVLLWLIMNVHLLLQCHGKTHFLVYVEGVLKMAWYGDVNFQQWAVTEFLVAEKESVSNNHQQLRNV
jgi:uncharacterized protein (UPF0261 family)